MTRGEAQRVLESLAGVHKCDMSPRQREVYRKAKVRALSRVDRAAKHLAHEKRKRDRINGLILFVFLLFGFCWSTFCCKRGAQSQRKYRKGEGGRREMGVERRLKGWMSA